MYERPNTNTSLIKIIVLFCLEEMLLCTVLYFGHCLINEHKINNEYYENTDLHVQIN